MFHSSQGDALKQAHKAIPEGHYEEEQGRGGFFGPVSHLVKKEPSTRWKKIEGPLLPRMYDLVELKPQNSWTRLLHNDEVSIYMAWQKPSQEKNLEAQRNADGDTIYFVHKGRGEVYSEYGLLSYRAGSYVVIPKCLTHVLAPKEDSQFLVIESRKSSYREPDRGMLGRNAIYDQNTIGQPDLAAQTEKFEEEKLSARRVVVKHSDESTTFEYEGCVFDTVSWKGDLFPYTLHMDDIMPVMSHRVHLPPSAHSTFVADGFVICSFLPRPLESDKDALRVPFYHQNIDYDEVIFYHNGDFFSRDGLHPGMMSFHPAGFPHGPHPKAVKEIDSKTESQEYAVMIDTRQKLQRSSEVTAVEVDNYWQSWSKS